jgi:hypothetical protein
MMYWGNGDWNWTAGVAMTASMVLFRVLFVAIVTSPSSSRRARYRCPSRRQQPQWSRCQRPPTRSDTGKSPCQPSPLGKPVGRLRRPSVPADQHHRSGPVPSEN